MILSVLVLEGIEKDQREKYEEYLKRQGKTANIYFRQTMLSQPNKDPQTFLKLQGIKFAEQLNLISGQVVSLYDQSGTIVSK